MDISNEYLIELCDYEYVTDCQRSFYQCSDGKYEACDHLHQLCNLALQQIGEDNLYYLLNSNVRC